MTRLIKLMGKDGDDGLLIPTAHIQGVETRKNSDRGGPYVMVGGRIFDVPQDVAFEIAAFVQSYWAHDAKDTVCVNMGWQPGSPDGLGERGA